MTAMPLPGMRRAGRAARWARRLGTFALMLLLVATLAHRWRLIETPAFFDVLLVDAALALLALACAAAGFAGLWQDGDRVGRDVAVGTLAALLALSPAIAAGLGVALHPALVDVATDPDDPPALSGGLQGGVPAAAGRPITPGNAALQAQAYPDIAGHRYDLGFDDALAMVREAIAAEGWTPGPRIDGDGEATLTAQARTTTLALPADVSVRVVDEGATVFIDMRSAWRFGWHDLGDNAARIQSFYLALDAMAATRPPPAPGSTSQ